MVNYSDIKGIHLEISSKCNASCPQCPRNTFGMDEELGFPVQDLSLADIKRMFTSDFIRQLERFLINGNFGDFVTAREGLEIVQYLNTCNPKLKIKISTNASARPKMWSELGAIPNVEVWFDIDGLEDTHHLYRRNTDWNMVISNAKKFIAAGGTAVWKMIIFDHNRHQVEACRAMSKELGFADFQTIDHGRDTGPVYNNKGELIYQIGSAPKEPYPASAVEFRSYGDALMSPEVKLQEYKTIPIKKTVTCKSAEYKEIYITANGEVYPCCWLGFYPKQEYKHGWQRDNMFLKDMVQNNNAIEVGLEKTLEWFNAVEASWAKNSYTDGRLFKCDENCGEGSIKL